MGETYIDYLICHLRELIFTLIDGTIQITGANYDQVYGILIGYINAPFASPLDCIQTELLSFIQFIQDKDSIFPGLQSQVIPSTSE